MWAWLSKRASPPKSQDNDDVGNKPSTEPIAATEDDELAKHVLVVKTKCQWAENYLEDISSEDQETAAYGQERLENTVKDCLMAAQDMGDEFHRSAMLNFISDLLSKAGQFDRATRAIEFISVDFIQDRATQFLDEQSEQISDV